MVKFFHGVRVEQIVVAEDERDSRLGGMLICNACMMAAELGYPGAFVVGDPEYFGKFGFIETAEYDIENVSGIDDKLVLACPTCTGGFRGVKRKGKFTLKYNIKAVADFAAAFYLIQVFALQASAPRIVRVTHFRVARRLQYCRCDLLVFKV